MGKGIRVRAHTGRQFLAAGAVADAQRSSANPDSLKAAGLAPRPPSRQPEDQRLAWKSVLKRTKERDMSRLAGRYTIKANSRTAGVSRQSQQAEATTRTGGRRSVYTGRRQLSATGTGGILDVSAERHDWLVPMELL